MNATEDSNRSRQGRIPATLQAVFLASNRGKEVNKPPPAAVASKVFFSNWLFQRQTGARKEKAGLFSGGKKNKKSKRSKNQPQKSVLEEKVAQTPKVKVCKAESPCTLGNASKLPIYQHYVSLTLPSSVHNSSGPYLGPNASGVHGRHDSLSGILNSKIRESFERILQQAFSTAAGELQCSPD
jgi:hypothetical protein